MKLNKDYKKRDQIIYGFVLSDNDYSGGCKRFEDLSFEKAQELLDNNFVNPEDNQNESPSFKEFLNFCKKYPNTKMYGYVISPRREDYRVTIEGLAYKGEVSKEMIIDFTNLCKYADDFVIENNELFCWYD